MRSKVDYTGARAANRGLLKQTVFYIARSGDVLHSKSARGQTIDGVYANGFIKHEPQKHKPTHEVDGLPSPRLVRRDAF